MVPGEMRVPLRAHGYKFHRLLWFEVYSLAASVTHVSSLNMRYLQLCIHAKSPSENEKGISNLEHSEIHK